MAASSSKPKRFRLSLVNAAEDVPRLVRAYGRACMGEFALVLRPREQRGVLVLMTKAEGARVWKAGDPPPSDQVRAVARVEGKRLRIETGPHAGVSFHPMNAAVERAIRGREGERVEVQFVPDDQFAELAEPLVAGDAPGIPATPIAPDAAVKLVKAEQKALPKAGPITLRGQWSGYLHCDEGAPRVELRRKLATYGVLHLESVAGRGWTWKVERTEKWFSEPGADQGEAATLLGAIEAGLRQAMGLLGEACSLRDSRRRSAYDSAWAETHPIRPAREGKDPTERLKPRAVKATGWTHFLHDDDAPEAEEIGRPTKAQRATLERGGLVLDPEAGTFFGRTTAAWNGYPAGSLVFREAHDNGFHIGPVSKARGPAKAPPPAAVDAPVTLPDVPATPAAMQRMEQEVTAEADALSDLRGLRWVWADSGVREDVAHWFDAQGLDHLGDQVRTFDGSPDQPLDAFIDGLKSDVRGERLTAEAQQQALARVDQLRAGWLEAPQLMERARKLIRYAAVMADSKLCRGKEKREAVEAVQRAVQAYDEARGAIVAGRAVDGLRTLRRIGERVALSAAKSARSCAGGQQSLTAAVREAPAKSAPKRGAVDTTSVPGLTIVDVGVQPRTADELRAMTGGHAQAFERDPKASTAKKWVKSALLHLGLEAASLSAKTRSFDDLGGGKRVFVSIVMPASAEGEETDAKLRLVSSATPRGLSIEDWDYASAGAQRAARGGGTVVAMPAATSPSSSAADVDPDKDKALLDAFSAAIAAAMQTA